MLKESPLQHFSQSKTKQFCNNVITILCYVRSSWVTFADWFMVPKEGYPSILDEVQFQNPVLFQPSIASFSGWCLLCALKLLDYVSLLATGNHVSLLQQATLLTLSLQSGRTVMNVTPSMMLRKALPCDSLCYPSLVHHMPLSFYRLSSSPAWSFTVRAPWAKFSETHSKVGVEEGNPTGSCPEHLPTGIPLPLCLPHFLRLRPCIPLSARNCYISYNSPCSSPCALSLSPNPRSAPHHAFLARLHPRLRSLRLWNGTGGPARRPREPVLCSHRRDLPCPEYDLHFNSRRSVLVRGQTWRCGSHTLL